MIRFIELVNETDFNPRMERTAVPRYSMGEVWINETYVVSVRPAPEYRKMLLEGRLPTELDAKHQFTAVTINEGSISRTHVVVGDISQIANRLQTNKERQLLKG